MFRDVHSTEGLGCGVDCSVAVLSGGGEGRENGDGEVEGVEEVGFMEEALEVASLSSDSVGVDLVNVFGGR